MLDRMCSFYQAQIVDRLKALREEEDGAALAEYAVIFVVIATAGAAGLLALGTEINDAFVAIEAWIATNVTAQF